MRCLEVGVKEPDRHSDVLGELRLPEREDFLFELLKLVFDGHVQPILLLHLRKAFVLVLSILTRVGKEPQKAVVARVQAARF